MNDTAKEDILEKAIKQILNPKFEDDGHFNVNFGNKVFRFVPNNDRYLVYYGSKGKKSMLEFLRKLDSTEDMRLYDTTYQVGIRVENLRIKAKALQEKIDREKKEQLQTVIGDLKLENQFNKAKTNLYNIEKKSLDSQKNNITLLAQNTQKLVEEGNNEIKEFNQKIKEFNQKIEGAKNLKSEDSEKQIDTLKTEFGKLETEKVKKEEKIKRYKTSIEESKKGAGIFFNEANNITVKAQAENENIIQTAREVKEINDTFVKDANTKLLNNPINKDSKLFGENKLKEIVGSNNVKDVISAKKEAGDYKLSDFEELMVGYSTQASKKLTLLAEESKIIDEKKQEIDECKISGQLANLDDIKAKIQQLNKELNQKRQQEQKKAQAVENAKNILIEGIKEQFKKAIANNKQLEEKTNQILSNKAEHDNKAKEAKKERETATQSNEEIINIQKEANKLSTNSLLKLDSKNSTKIEEEINRINQQFKQFEQNVEIIKEKVKKNNSTIGQLKEEANSLANGSKEIFEGKDNGSGQKVDGAQEKLGGVEEAQKELSSIFEKARETLGEANIEDIDKEITEILSKHSEELREFVDNNSENVTHEDLTKSMEDIANRANTIFKEAQANYKLENDFTTIDPNNLGIDAIQSKFNEGAKKKLEERKQQEKEAQQNARVNNLVELIKAIKAADEQKQNLEKNSNDILEEGKKVEGAVKDANDKRNEGENTKTEFEKSKADSFEKLKTDKERIKKSIEGNLNKEIIKKAREKIAEIQKKYNELQEQYTNANKSIEKANQVIGWQRTTIETSKTNSRELFNNTITNNKSFNSSKKSFDEKYGTIKNTNNFTETDLEAAISQVVGLSEELKNQLKKETKGDDNSFKLDGLNNVMADIAKKARGLYEGAETENNKIQSAKVDEEISKLEDLNDLGLGRLKEQLDKKEEELQAENDKKQKIEDAKRSLFSAEKEFKIAEDGLKKSIEIEGFSKVKANNFDKSVKSAGNIKEGIEEQINSLDKEAVIIPKFSNNETTQAKIEAINKKIEEINKRSRDLEDKVFEANNAIKNAKKQAEESIKGLSKDKEDAESCYEESLKAQKTLWEKIGVFKESLGKAGLNEYEVNSFKFTKSEVEQITGKKIETKNLSIDEEFTIQYLTDRMQSYVSETQKKYDAISKRYLGNEFDSIQFNGINIDKLSQEKDKLEKQKLREQKELDKQKQVDQERILGDLNDLIRRQADLISRTKDNIDLSKERYENEKSEKEEEVNEIRNNSNAKAQGILGKKDEILKQKENSEESDEEKKNRLQKENEEIENLKNEIDKFNKNVKSNNQKFVSYLEDINQIKDTTNTELKLLKESQVKQITENNKNIQELAKQYEELSGAEALINLDTLKKVYEAYGKFNENEETTNNERNLGFGLVNTVIGDLIELQKKTEEAANQEFNNTIFEEIDPLPDFNPELDERFTENQTQIEGLDEPITVSIKKQNEKNSTPQQTRDGWAMAAAILENKNGENREDLGAEQLGEFSKMLDAASRVSRDQATGIIQNDEAFEQLGKEHPNTNRGVLVGAGRNVNGGHTIHVAALGDYDIKKEPITVCFTLGKGENARNYEYDMPQGTLYTVDKDGKRGDEVSPEERERVEKKVDLPDMNNVVNKSNFNDGQEKDQVRGNTSNKLEVLGQIKVADEQQDEAKEEAPEDQQKTEKKAEEQHEVQEEAKNEEKNQEPKVAALQGVGTHQEPAQMQSLLNKKNSDEQSNELSGR